MEQASSNILGLFAQMTVLFIDRARPAERRALLRRQLLRLAGLLCSQVSGRAAERVVGAALKRYARSNWGQDSQTAFYAGGDEARSVSFEIMKLSDGELPSARTLQRIFRKNFDCAKTGVDLAQ